MPDQYQIGIDVLRNTISVEEDGAKN